VSEDVKEYSQSLGQHLVGTDFNPSCSPGVITVKEGMAAMIDFISKHGKDPRCTAISITHLENAAMWMVKSLTKPERT
jgi:hypothetical protein